MQEKEKIANHLDLAPSQLEEAEPLQPAQKSRRKIWSATAITPSDLEISPEALNDLIAFGEENAKGIATSAEGTVPVHEYVSIFVALRDTAFPVASMYR